MKICIVTPHFKPLPGGVADHSFELCHELIRKGHEVKVFTSVARPKKILNCSFQTLPDWSLGSIWQVRNEIQKISPDLIFYQWTPLPFAKGLYGIAPNFLFLLVLLANYQSLVMVHESHYPVELNLKGLLIGVPHFIQFVLLSFLADKISFSHEANLKKWSRFLPFCKQKFHVLTVFSNINIAPLRSLEELNVKQLPLSKYKLVYFGGSHITNSFVHVREALDRAQKDLGESNVNLYLIGLKEEEAKKIFYGYSGVYSLGYLKEEEVSNWLHYADLVLCPFTDGATTRRGTIMASLIHGKPFVTTWSYYTTDSIPWKKICLICSVENINEYAKLVLQGLKNLEKAKQIGFEGQKFYHLHLSKENVVKQIESMII